ncbi:hypothetical protein ACFQX7_03825 [Luedemannella flava]
MDTIAAAGDRLPEVFGWLGERGIAPADAPFFKYDVIDMAATLVIEVGVPVAEPVEGRATSSRGSCRRAATPPSRTWATPTNWRA